MNKLVLTVGVVALLAVLALGVSLPNADVSQKGPQGEQGLQGVAGQAGPQGERGPAGAAGQGVSGLSGLLTSLQNLVSNLANQPSQQFGSVTGPTLPTETFQGLLGTAVVSGTCADATTTLAVITNPFTSTSTAIRAFVSITSPATTTMRLNLATSTLLGFADAPGNSTTTGLINRVTLSGLTTGTTTIVGDLLVGTETANNPGFGSRAFNVAPRQATTTPNNRLILSVVARGEDSLAGVTNTNNNFACNYAVEFKTIIPR